HLVTVTLEVAEDVVLCLLEQRRIGSQGGVVSSGLTGIGEEAQGFLGSVDVGAVDDGDSLKQVVGGAVSVGCLNDGQDGQQNGQPTKRYEFITGLHPADSATHIFGSRHTGCGHDRSPLKRALSL